MPTLTLRTLRLVTCVTATVTCADGLAAPGVEAFVHRDGFEARDLPALVADAVDRTGAIRVSATEYWYSTLQLPSALTVLGFDDPYPAGPASATLQSGLLVLDFDGDLAGESLGFAAWLQADALRWVCGNAPPPLDSTLLSAAPASTHTSLPDAVLPDACRSEPSPPTLVQEAWSATAGPRTAVTEYWMSVAPPATLAEVGLDDPLPVARARLQLDDGLLVATFVDPLGGETLAFAPWLQAGSLRWVCGHAPPPVDATLQSGATSAARTSLPEAVLPPACRSDVPLAMQVQDALNATAPVRLAIAEYHANGGALPVTLAAAGLDDPYPAGRARLQLDEGVLIATFVGDLEGERLGVAPYERNGSLLWVCGHSDPPPDAVPLATGTASANTTIDSALLPAGCR